MNQVKGKKEKKEAKKEAKEMNQVKIQMKEKIQTIKIVEWGYASRNKRDS